MASCKYVAKFGLHTTGVDVMKKQSQIWLYLLAFTGLTWSLGCSSESPVSEKKGAATAEVNRQDLVGYKFFDAQLVVPKYATAIVTSPFRLPVSQVSTAVGKHIDKGDPIMTLALPEARQMLQQAQANLQAAQSDYSSAKSRNQGPLNEASKQLADAKAAEGKAKSDEAAGIATDVESAVQARKDAESYYNGAKQEFEAAVASEREAVESASRFVSEARTGAKMTVIRAPISGTVVTLDATVGTEVGAEPKKPVATIVNYNQFFVLANVPAEDKDKVEKDTAVMFTSDDRKIGQIEGKVTNVKVAPPHAGDAGSKYVATISFDNTKGVVQQSTLIKKVGVKTGVAKDVLVVPLAAITRSSDGKQTVTVQEGDKLTEVEVQTGLTDGALVEITSGLTAGQIVRVPTNLS